jgi:hypothetical protein
LIFYHAIILNKRIVFIYVFLKQLAVQGHGLTTSGPNFKVPLFRCKWFNLKNGVQIDPQYGMTTVDLKNLGYDTEPFVLASEVAQVFYVKDMSTKPKKKRKARGHIIR